MAVGYLLRIIGVMEAKHAGIINRFAFYVAEPALIISAAAPALLFTLGITLAGSSLVRLGPAAWLVATVKLLLHPILSVRASA